MLINNEKYELQFKTDEEFIEYAEANKKFEKEMEHSLEQIYWEFDARSKKVDDRQAFKESLRGILRYFYIKYANCHKQVHKLPNCSYNDLRCK